MGGEFHEVMRCDLADFSNGSQGLRAISFARMSHRPVCVRVATHSCQRWRRHFTLDREAVVVDRTKVKITHPSPGYDFFNGRQTLKRFVKAVLKHG